MLCALATHSIETLFQSIAFAATAKRACTLPFLPPGARAVAVFPLTRRAWYYVLCRDWYLFVTFFRCICTLHAPAPALCPYIKAPIPSPSALARENSISRKRQSIYSPAPSIGLVLDSQICRRLEEVGQATSEFMLFTVTSSTPVRLFFFHVTKQPLSRHLRSPIFCLSAVYSHFQLLAACAVIIV
jgi:hypothetical protein